jgi:hypothetical protein
MSQDNADLQSRLDDLKTEHRQLDAELERLVNDPLVDDLQIQRLKKRKLFLKDSIVQIEAQLVPDMSA